MNGTTDSSTIAGAQRRVADICKSRGWSDDPLSSLAHMIEEVGELARELLTQRNHGGQHSSTDTDVRRIGEELSDILFLTLKLANTCDLSLADAFPQKLRSLCRRYEPLV